MSPSSRQEWMSVAAGWAQSGKRAKGARALEKGLAINPCVRMDGPSSGVSIAGKASPSERSGPSGNTLARIPNGRRHAVPSLWHSANGQSWRRRFRGTATH